MILGDSKVNKNILIDICLDEIDAAKDKLRSIKNDKDQKLLFEGWIRRQKQLLKELNYRKQRNEKSQTRKDKKNIE